VGGGERAGCIGGELLSETWIIKDSAPVDAVSFALNRVSIPFTSNNESFVGLEIYTDDVTLWLRYLISDSQVNEVATISIADGENQFYWGASAAYRTLVFDAAPTGELLAWLTKNADKMTETWIIKDSAPAELYEFLTTVNIAFISNGESFTSFGYVDCGDTCELQYSGSTVAGIIPADPNSGPAFEWTNSAYKTVTFATAPTGDLLAWLTKNADKQTTLDYLTTDEDLSKVADAIRSKGGTSDPLVYPDGFVTAIGALRSTPLEESDINFWDYDGTLLYAWTLAELADKTELPPLPSHEGLVCQGWNWTLEDIKAAGRELDIGALYITDDGKTRLYVDVDTETWDDFVLNYWQSTANATTVDWGDGTTPETKNADSWTEHRHVYASSGSYVITMSVAEGATMRLGRGSSSYMLIANGETDSGRCAMLAKVEIGERVTRVTKRAFYNACRLRSISVPSGVLFEPWRTFEQATHIRAVTAAFSSACIQTFYQCASLRAIASAKGTTQEDNYAIAYTAIRRMNFDMTAANLALALERVRIKAVNGTVGNFSACHSLLEATIPADAATFTAAGFQGCNALRKVTCLGDIASIPAQVFQRCFPLRFVDFTHCTAVPTLANVNAFDQTHAQLEIRVPAALAEEWKAATNWSSLAEHIVGVEA